MIPIDDMKGDMRLSEINPYLVDAMEKHVYDFPSTARITCQELPEKKIKISIEHFLKYGLKVSYGLRGYSEDVKEYNRKNIIKLLDENVDNFCQLVNDDKLNDLFYLNCLLIQLLNILTIDEFNNICKNLEPNGLIYDLDLHKFKEKGIKFVFINDGFVRFSTYEKYNIYDTIDSEDLKPYISNGYLILKFNIIKMKIKDYDCYHIENNTRLKLKDILKYVGKRIEYNPDKIFSDNFCVGYKDEYAEKVKIIKENHSIFKKSLYKNLFSLNSRRGKKYYDFFHNLKTYGTYKNISNIPLKIFQKYVLEYKNLRPSNFKDDIVKIDVINNEVENDDVDLKKGDYIDLKGDYIDLKGEDSIDIKEKDEHRDKIEFKVDYTSRKKYHFKIIESKVDKVKKAENKYEETYKDILIKKGYVDKKSYINFKDKDDLIEHYKKYEIIGLMDILKYSDTMSAYENSFFEKEYKKYPERFTNFGTLVNKKFSEFVENEFTRLQRLYSNECKMCDKKEEYIYTHKEKIYSTPITKKYKKKSVFCDYKDITSFNIYQPLYAEFQCYDHINKIEIKDINIVNNFDTKSKYIQKIASIKKKTKNKFIKDFIIKNSISRDENKNKKTFARGEKVEKLEKNAIQSNETVRIVKRALSGKENNKMEDYINCRIEGKEKYIKKRKNVIKYSKFMEGEESDDF